MTTSRFALGALLGILAWIFSTEVLVMLILSLLPPFSVPIEAFLDAFVLSVFVFPILYVLLFRPLVLRIARVAEQHRKQAELVKDKNMELQAQKQRLEAQSQQLIAQQQDLKEANRQLAARAEELEDARMASLNMLDDLNRARAETDATNRELEDKNLQLERAIERANRMATAAEVASMAKSEFLANMSHEIRTPMTAILGYTELMLDPDQSPSERLDCIQIIHRNGEHLLAIINDILDLSKIEAGMMTVEHVECSPAQIVAEVASLLRGRAIGKNLFFDIEYLGAIPKTIRSDPTRLRQILINLGGNALKFTESGGVRLIIKMDDPVDAPAPRLRFDVLDTGIGMSEEQVEHLFNPFEQADSSTTRKFGGTGLGLTISKRLAEILGGDITVQSEQGRGSAFMVTVGTGPLAGVEMVDGVHESLVDRDALRQGDGGDERKLDGRILLAEDGPDNQRLISFLLRNAGAEVTVAENGRIAVDKALAAVEAHRPFDLILMDMQMPVLDGYGAVGELRAKGCTKPIIALTAHAMDSDREECLRAGCDDFATKPIDRAHLLALAAAYMRKDHVQPPPAPEAQDLSEPGPEPPPLVSEFADDPDMAELIEAFVNALPNRIAAIQRAVDDASLQDLRELAHQLKGSAGGYGFDAITQLAAAVEQDIKADADLDTVHRSVRVLLDLCRRATHLSEMEVRS